MESVVIADATGADIWGAPTIGTGITMPMAIAATITAVATTGAVITALL